MRWLQQIRMMLAELLQRRSKAQKLDSELQFHLEQQVQENLAAGMAPDEARAAALRLFGNPSVFRDEARSAWSWSSLEKAWRDVRYGSRTLTRAPGFAITAILVMALGIGATTSLFTLVRSVLLRPLPFQDPDKLVMVYEHFRASTRSDSYNVVAPADFHAWRDQTHGFQDMAAYRGWGANLTDENSQYPEVVIGLAGSWNIFSVLGVQPALGRTFTPDDDRPGAPDVVILNWNLFQSRFNGDRSVVGRQVKMNSKPYTIIGVLPEWFTYPDPQLKLWVPYDPSLTPDELQAHDRHQSYVVARLRDGVSAQAATRQVSALQFQLHQQFPGPVAEDALSRPMIDDFVEDAKTPLIVLLAAVGCMLLIACLNVSNLLVARGAARRREVAIRGALGGSRLTLIREQMTESLLICGIGGLLGLVLSFLATRWLASHWTDLPRADAIHADGMVLGFAVALVFVSALLAGLLPAISSTGKVLLSALQDSSRSVGGSASRAALRKTLLTAEIALTVVLLVSAGLLFKSFVNLRTSDLGCVTTNVLTMGYGLPLKQYDTPSKVLAFHETLLNRVRALPGVRAAGLVSRAPGAGYGGDQVFTIPEKPSTSGFQLENDAIVRSADPGYFSALEIPLLSGRVFTEQDRLERSDYMVVDHKFASQFFPGESPLGKHITMLWHEKLKTFEIIGVVGDTLFRVGEPVKATVYFPIFSGVPWEQGGSSGATLVVRTSGEPLNLAMVAQKQIAALDPGLPVQNVATMQEIIGKSTATQSFSASLVLGFAVLSLLLAAVGLYGVLSYLVTQRVPEIGIRMALGAQRSQVLRLVLVDGMKPVLIGLVLGIGGGIAAGILIKSLLFGMKPVDPVVFAGMIASLLLTATLASAIPALRASRIQPTEALRTE